MTEPLRPEPSAETSFADLVRTRDRGKLKLYIGSAAGTGKTYRMLNEAHQLRGRGVDVVVGFVETHGRTETEAQLRHVRRHYVTRDNLRHRQSECIDPVDAAYSLCNVP